MENSCKNKKRVLYLQCLWIKIALFVGLGCLECDVLVDNYNGCGGWEGRHSFNIY